MGALNKWAPTWPWKRKKPQNKTKKSPKSTTTNYCVANGYSQIREACANNNKRIHDTTSINLSWLVLVFVQWGWKKDIYFKNPLKDDSMLRARLSAARSLNSARKVYVKVSYTRRNIISCKTPVFIIFGENVWNTLAFKSTLISLLFTKH